MELKELYEALALAQSEMGNAIKDGSNPHFRSGYATLPQVIDCVIPALNKNGLSVIQIPGMGDAGVSVKTILTHKSGQTMDFGEIICHPKDRGPQAVGSVITYLRRYSLMSIFGIGQIDDDGEAGEGRINEAEKNYQKKSQENIDSNPNGLIFWKNQINECQNIYDLEKTANQIALDKTLSKEQVAELRNLYSEKVKKLTKKEGK